MVFKPMLGVTAEKDKIKFPAMVSLKLDGIRCICINGELFSRSLKPIGNIQLRERFKEMMDYSREFNVIFDGELYSHDLTFQEITSMVNSSNKDISDSLKFYCFDFIKDNDFNMPFKHRNYLLLANDIENVVNVKQVMVKILKILIICLKRHSRRIKWDYLLDVLMENTSLVVQQ